MKNIIIIFLLLICFNFLHAGEANVESKKVIYLSGEYHFGDGNDEDSKFKKMINKLAAERKLVYAQEGLEREKQAEKEYGELIGKMFGSASSASIYGVEDPLYFLFDGALIMNNELRSLQKRKGKMHDSLYKIFLNKKIEILCPLVHKANQKFLSDFWNSEALIGNPIFEYLRANKNKLLNKKFEAQQTILTVQILQWDDSYWIDFGKEVALILAPLVESMISESKMEVFQFVLSCLEDFEIESNCDYRAQSSLLLQAVIRTLRDDFIIKNLEQIHSFAKKKPVVCILGKLHIDNVKLELEKRGFLVLGKDEFMDRMRKDGL